MILTDREIKIYLQRHLITIDPVPDEDIAYQSTAVDLTLDQTISIFKSIPSTPGVRQITEVDPHDPNFNSDAVIKALTDSKEIDQTDGYPLNPDILILGWTKEYIDLKESRIAARVEGKSSLARLGLSIHLTAQSIHAGFQGRIRLEIINHGHYPIILRRDMRICQLIFEQTFGTPDKDYKGQFFGQLPGP